MTNFVFLVGRLTRDVEVKTGKSGTAFTNFSVAVNEKTGEKDVTTFVDCTAFGKTAERLTGAAKGAFVMLAGKLRLDSWQDKSSGQDRSKLKVIVERISVSTGETQAAPAQAAVAPGTLAGEEFPW